MKMTSAGDSQLTHKTDNSDHCFRKGNFGEGLVCFLGANMFPQNPTTPSCLGIWWHQPSELTCKRKEEQQQQQQKNPNTPKKPRLVFTDLQRRTLQAIFKETKRPSKEMQITISQQLGLELSTVGNFFMNARRRSQDKWQDTEDKAKSSHLLNGHHHHLLHLSPTTTT
ncbi:unnamed protein product [Larinioides sclopetarius]|uniref:Homeobox domain-containing protein n=1 Tax=Larinioides sclopetarius TaxID=280406 RepID=A0AAV2B956_9ARAC